MATRTRNLSGARAVMAALALGSALIPPFPAGAQSHEEGIPDPLTDTLNKLRERSQVPVIMRAEHGQIRSVQFSIALENPTREPVEDAYAFLELYAELFQIPAPRLTLYLARVVRSELGTSVFFDQHFDGITVHGARLAIYLDRDRATGLSGAWLSGAPPSLQPVVAGRRAAEIALASAGDGSAIAGSPRLMHYAPALLGSGPMTRESPQQLHDALAWRVSAQASSGGWYFMIDAMTGEVLSRAPIGWEALHYTIQSANGSDQSFFCNVTGATGWFTQNGLISGATPDLEGFRANNALRATYNLFAQLGRDAWDGRGGSMLLTLDRGLGAMPGGTANAFYNPGCNDLVFSNDMAAVDILAHEFTHGVVQFSARLERGDILLPALQSASLNEHYSDVFAALIDTANWTLGEQSGVGLIRDMGNPLNPAALNAGPDRNSQITSDRRPHINANIMNKAAFLIGQGQTFNGIPVAGIGRQKLGRLYFTTLTTRLTPTSGFQTAADQTMVVARSIFTPSDACSVSRAFSAIELDGDLDCDGLPDSADSDTDGDGVANAADNCPSNPNPGQQNTDAGTGDTLGDACDPDIDADGRVNSADNCPFAVNPNQADWNSDGVGDACSDADGDGVVDSQDNCRFQRNPDRRDTDGDGEGDACDLDADGDGVCYDPLSGGGPGSRCTTQMDNCPLDINSTQIDGDGDGAGDACDLCPMTPDSGIDTDADGLDDACDADDDQDGVADGSDNCPLESNADQLDLNGNGLGLACDPTETVQFDPNGSRIVLDTSFRTRFARHTIPLGCRPEGLELAFGGGEEVLDIGFDSSVPVGVAIVNRAGERLTSLFPATSGRVQMPIARDFCPLPGSSEEGSLAALAAETFSLEITLLEPTPDLRFSMDGGIAPFDPPAVKPVEEDDDVDGVLNAFDNCPFFATGIVTDTDLDGRGDMCECSDQNADGRNDVRDLVAINTAIFNPTLVTPLCDGNNDRKCNVSDIISANIEIFSPTSTSTCDRYPAPGP